jgi:hypothetical protein
MKQPAVVSGLRLTTGFDWQVNNLQLSLILFDDRF